MGHIIGDQVVARLGGQGVDSALAAHLADVSSAMVDVQWSTSPYPWNPNDDQGIDAPADVQEQCLQIATLLYRNATSVGGGRQVTLEDVAQPTQRISSWVLHATAVETMRWHDMNGKVG